MQAMSYYSMKPSKNPVCLNGVSLEVVLTQMKEIKNEEPDYFQMALKELGFTDQEKRIVNLYGHMMFLTAISFFDNPDNEDKVFTIEDFRVYADEEYPGGWELFEKVLKKAEELEQGASGNIR